MKFFLVLFSATFIVSQGGCPAPSAPSAAPVFTYAVVAEYPHDTGAFTQGLVFDGGRLFEGTGLFGESTLREVELETGAVSRSVALDDTLFGEGVTLFGDRIIQLTWLSDGGFVYDRDTFDLLGEFDYPPQMQEGWGITHDGERLIVSDGTSVIRFLDPETFEEIGSIPVVDGETAIVRLNELEYIDGEIYANVWQTNRIARIDPDTGAVNSWIDLTGLLPANERAAADWLNGIAYDAAGDRLFVTGKLWPTLFEIELVPAAW